MQSVVQLRDLGRPAEDRQAPDAVTIIRRAASERRDWRAYLSYATVSKTLSSEKDAVTNGT